MQKKKGTIGRKKVSSQTGKKERRRITQLLLCVILFLVVFAGKELKGAEEFQSGQMILQMLQSNTDFSGMIQTIGDVFSGNMSVLGQFEELAVEVFGQQEPTENNAIEEKESDANTEEVGDQPSEPKDLEPEAEPMPTEPPVQQEEKEQEIQPEQETTDQEEPAASLEAEAYAGPALPEGATMEYYELDLGETVTPVLGRLTSPYGYRVDPISGGEDDFHVGVDLSAEIGTPILSFASGTVDFIGESDGYGLYVQIDHGNGVKTFYCHCSQLCVRKGMQVGAGQMIAKTGNTGNTTGPHLHMEMRLNGVLINPEYYIEVLPL